MFQMTKQLLHNHTLQPDTAKDLYMWVVVGKQPVLKNAQSIFAVTQLVCWLCTVLHSSRDSSESCSCHYNSSTE